ncbi:PIN domain-containing protein [Aromatoleum aromaticum]|nr:PIN domain-containing protein [Aromatoleum aromaticum]
MSFARPVVIDTGVLVSAAIRPDSTPALTLEKALLHFDVCVSEATLAELETVLSRPKFDRYATPDDRRAFLAGFTSDRSGWKSGIRSANASILRTTNFSPSPKPPKPNSSLPATRT